jgi:hypothetical protein
LLDGYFFWAVAGVLSASVKALAIIKIRIIKRLISSLGRNRDRATGTYRNKGAAQ